MKQSNEFNWDTYKVPQPENVDAESETFRIRHLCAGRTGARKTWAAAPALLNYLTLKDGLQSLVEKNIEDDSVLDMGVTSDDRPLVLPNKPCNVLELGGGSGFLSVGLAKAIHSSMPSSSPHDAKIICTDMDKNTIKNMRHNICENKETKTVAIEKLEWGDDIGGEKFAKALERKFKVTTNHHSSTNPITQTSDPVQLLTHVIGSDVHYGETTLDPLSSIISSIKRRNPKCQMIIMMKERSPNAVADLVEQIERKVRKDIQNFSVHVRDVIQSGVPEFRMKLVEC